jgi:hypothetical protein
MGTTSSGHNTLVYGCSYFLRHSSLLQSAIFCKCRTMSSTFKKSTQPPSSESNMLHSGFLHGLFYLKDRGKMFLRNMCEILMRYKILHHRRWFSSVTTVTSSNTNIWNFLPPKLHSLLFLSGSLVRLIFGAGTFRLLPEAEK